MLLNRVTLKCKLYSCICMHNTSFFLKNFSHVRQKNVWRLKFVKKNTSHYVPVHTDVTRGGGEGVQVPPLLGLHPPPPPGGGARIPSKFTRFAGLISCCYQHFHRNCTRFIFHLQTKKNSRDSPMSAPNENSGCPSAYVRTS